MPTPTNLSKLPRSGIILFDSHCPLCTRSVLRIIDNDPNGHWYFAAAQSPLGKQLQQQAGIDALKQDTLILLTPSACYIRSSAAVRIAAKLRFPWKLLALSWLAPKPLRDAGYSIIARNRTRCNSTCSLTPPIDHPRILDSLELPPNTAQHKENTRHRSAPDVP